MPSTRFNMSLNGKPHPTSQLLGCFGIQALTHHGGDRLSALANRLGYDQQYFSVREEDLETDLAIWEGQQNYVVFVRGTQNTEQYKLYLASISSVHQVDLGEFVMQWAMVQGRYIFNTFIDVLQSIERTRRTRPYPSSVRVFGHSLGGAAAYTFCKLLTLHMNLTNRHQAGYQAPDIQLMTFGEPKSAAGRSVLAEWAGTLPSIEPATHQRIITVARSDATTSFVPSGHLLQDPISQLPPGFLVSPAFLGSAASFFPDNVRGALARIPSTELSVTGSSFLGRFASRAKLFTVLQVASSRYLLALVPTHRSPAFLYYVNGQEELARTNFIENFIDENYIGAADNMISTGWALHTLDNSYMPMAVARYEQDRDRRTSAGEANLDTILPVIRNWIGEPIAQQRNNMDYEEQQAILDASYQLTRDGYLQLQTAQQIRYMALTATSGLQFSDQLRLARKPHNHSGSNQGSLLSDLFPYAIARLINIGTRSRDAANDAFFEQLFNSDLGRTNSTGGGDYGAAPATQEQIAEFERLGANALLELPLPQAPGAPLLGNLDIGALMALRVPKDFLPTVSRIGKNDYGLYFRDICAGHFPSKAKAQKFGHLLLRALKYLSNANSFVISDTSDAIQSFLSDGSNGNGTSNGFSPPLPGIVE